MIFASKKLQIFAAVLAAAIPAAILVAYALLEPDFQIVERELAMRGAPHWDARLDGLKILLISDLHLTKSFLHSGIPQRLQETVNRRDADLVFILGDIIQTHAPYQEQPTFGELAQYLQGFQSRIGTFAVYGNHEGGSRRNRGRRDIFNRSFGSNGLNLLDYRTQNVEFNGASLRLAGGYHPAWVLPESPGNTPTIMLAHDPQFFDAADHEIMLCCAGHLHGGQIRLFDRSPLGLLVPYDRGEYLVPAPGGIVRRLYVTSGMGTGFPWFRLGCPPEAVLLTLRDR